MNSRRSRKWVAPCGWAAQPAKLVPGSVAQAAYGCEEIAERHRHRYEFNNTYRQQFEANGMRFSGTSPDGGLVEIVEVAGSPLVCCRSVSPRIQV